MIRIACLLFAGLFAGAAQAAAPATLECVSDGSLNWRDQAPVLLGTETSVDERGGPIIHLDPDSGEWFLQVPGSRALTNGGGTFEIVRSSDFSAYYHEWVGIDHDTMMRIWGGGGIPFRFVFVSNRSGTFLGRCTVPEETFIFLGEPGQ